MQMDIYNSLMMIMFTVISLSTLYLHVILRRNKMVSTLLPSWHYINKAIARCRTEPVSPILRSQINTALSCMRISATALIIVAVLYFIESIGH